ncbi:hypothetical protein [Burkholderia pseudomallei]|uniref:hypothetical protein n=1 Tax=Burkholderia pseudomallei TaxID=28450 RepID=UPI0003248126|nr:hypothetical protein [Burkholderia pseudomallei]AJX62717.1 hypothetical protein DP47_3383 [Burkholderia pseudomallei Pasteur 52237]MWA16577.1 hypothetical protein [Burkholderia pseudomallei]VBQ80987.1 Uncharacterised protein [Burkholderia pseudomallei]
MAESRPLTDDEVAVLAKHMPPCATLISASTDGDVVEVVVNLPRALSHIYISPDVLRSVT